MAYTRKYKEEAKYHATEVQKKARNVRNQARRQKIAAGKLRKGDPRDVHHKVSPMRGGTNAPGNIALLHRSAS